MGIHTSRVNWSLGVADEGEQGERILFDLSSGNAEECRVTLVLYSLARDLSEVTGLFPFP